MKQEVNLYQDIFRPQKKPLSAASIGAVLLLCLVFVTAAYAYQWLKVASLKEELAEAENRNGQLITEIDKLARQFPVKAKSRLLETEIIRLERELESRNAIGEALARYSLENKKAFSSVLESLARRHVDGTWLTRVSIKDGGNSLGFAGKTYASELVPIYIQQLSDETVFSNLSFNRMELNRSADDPSSLDFRVSTSAGSM